MQCTSPVKIGKDGQEMLVPCCKCVSCRIARCREWSIRVLHESEFHENSVFVTLTYDDENLPKSNSIEKAVLQRFFKRLRKRYLNRHIRYFACGEYGKDTFRAHYHSIIFGIGLDDFIPFKKINGKMLYRHPSWSFGHIFVGDVNYQSARYVANYMNKYYLRPEGLELGSNMVRPFQLMSKGLGLGYCLLNANQIKDNMNITLNGKSVGIPRYYKKKIGIMTDELFEISKKVNAQVLDHYKKNYPQLDDEQLYRRYRKSKKQMDKNIKKRVELFENQREKV